jgi:hypothetical protein
MALCLCMVGNGRVTALESIESETLWRWLLLENNPVRLMLSHASIEG